MKFRLKNNYKKIYILTINDLKYLLFIDIVEAFERNIF